ncbi:MAG TPA: hypothetical protein DF774_05545 [Rheinheimera sp.]|nr:hypothetical protein [Rheinheimera sp.]
MLLISASCRIFQCRNYSQALSVRKIKITKINHLAIYLDVEPDFATGCYGTVGLSSAAKLSTMAPLFLVCQ